MRLITLFFIIILASACGGGETTQPTTAKPPSPPTKPPSLPTSASVTTAALSETGPFVFQPPDVIIAVGGRVSWTVPAAAGTIRHSVTANSGNWAADTLGASQTLTKTFPVAGDFPYFCVFHDGMVGVVSVR